MKILITGGAGFIGKNLCLALLQKGHQVVVIDNFLTSSKADFKNFLKGKKIKFFEGDICDLKLIKKIQKSHKFDQIYHLACPTGVPNLVTLAEEMILACSLGTKNILELAKAQKAPIIFTSSSEIYGDPEVSPQSEDYTGNVDPIGVRSPYEEGKRFSESLLKMYSNKFGLNGKIVRLFNTYGPHMSKKDMRVIPQFLEAALKGKGLPVKGKGLQKRTFCYVSDLVEGLILVLEKGKAGEVYNLGGDEEISMVSLAKLVIQITASKSQIKYIDRESHDHKARMPDLTKVKKLGWKRQVNLKEGLVKTLQLI